MEGKEELGCADPTARAASLCSNGDHDSAGLLLPPCARLWCPLGTFLRHKGAHCAAGKSLILHRTVALVWLTSQEVAVGSVPRFPPAGVGLCARDQPWDADTALGRETMSGGFPPPLYPAAIPGLCLSPADAMPCDAVREPGWGSPGDLEPGSSLPPVPRIHPAGWKHEPASVNHHPLTSPLQGAKSLSARAERPAALCGTRGISPICGPSPVGGWAGGSARSQGGAWGAGSSQGVADRAGGTGQRET